MLNRLPHPFDLEIQDFSAYSLILDLRGQDEWLCGHIPGSVCRPGLSKSDEQELDEMLVSGFGNLEESRHHRVNRQIEDHIDSILGMAQQGRILVYCARGGHRSQLAAKALLDRGHAVDVLRGGWSAYWRWVQSALDVYFQAINWVPISSLERVPAEDESGDVAQVLNLNAVMASPGMMLFTDRDGRLPSGIFDSVLLDLLRHYDRSRVVYFVPIQSSTLTPLRLPAGLQRVIQMMAR